MSKRLTPESESLLWDEFIAGKEDAFGKIYDLYVYPLFRFGCHISNDHGLVQDCIQDLFVDLFRYRSKLSKTENISVYLYVSLKRKIIKSVVKEFKNRSVTLENLPFEYLIRSSDDLENDESVKQVQALTKALEKLTDRQREAIYLRFVAGLDYDEMCGILKLNYQGARNLIHRGMEKLRETCKVSTIILFLAGSDKCVVQHV